MSPRTAALGNHLPMDHLRMHRSPTDRLTAEPVTTRRCEPLLARLPVRGVILRVGLLGLLLAGLPGCQSINVGTSNAAELRVIDASVDAPGLDVYQNKTAIAYNLGFGTVTSYVALAPGSYTVSALKANTQTTLVAAGQTFGSTKQYTAIVGNVAANLQETILTDQSTPAPSGQISVRVVDQATRAGAVDIYLVPSTGKLTTTLPFVTNVNFGSNTGYINVPAGTYAIAVVPTGTVPVSTTVTLMTGPSVGYLAGAVRTLVLIDQQVTTTPGVQAIVAPDFDSPSA